MKLTALLSAAALAAGMCLASSASAQVTGTVKIDGQAPEPQQINMASNPQCAAAHPNPVLEESIVAGDNGELANVVVNIKAPEGKQLKGEAPKTPVVLDQKGCHYTPHVFGVWRDEAGVFHVGAEEVPFPAAGTRRERVTAYLEAEARAFERRIAAAPEQWLAIFHPLWPDLEKQR